MNSKGKIHLHVIIQLLNFQNIFKLKFMASYEKIKMTSKRKESHQRVGDNLIFMFLLSN